MNNVIVNNKPRPVVPAPLVIGRTQSVFSFGGFSLWRDETLDKEIKSAQERHANEIERYKEKAKAWDELTSYTHSVFLDTNIFHNNESAGLSLDEVVSICKEKGWEVTVSTLAVDELKHQVKVKDRSEKDAEKGKRAEIALSKIKELYTFEEEFVFTVNATVANSAQEKALADKRAVAVSLLLLSCKEDKKKEIQKVPFYKKILIRIFTILKKKSDICSSVIVAALAMAFPALVSVAIVLVFIIGEILTVFCDTVMDYLIE